MIKDERRIHERFDDVVVRLDVSQRADASIRQVLSFLVQEVHDLKRRQAVDEERWP
jgi:hypothetical protein